MTEKTKQDLLQPGDELETIIREATTSVERQLAIEDAGWVNLTSRPSEVVTDAERILNLQLSRLYYIKDPLGKQSIRLWTDYTFGKGMTFRADEEATQKVLTEYWKAPENRNVLSARGQRKSSDKLLVDGEIFFVQFLSPGGITVRWIDPLQITRIITDPDDIEKVMYYERTWTDGKGVSHTDYYRSTSNMKDEGAEIESGTVIRKTADGLVSHLTYNTIGQRGNPLLLPALDWIKQYRRFLASRIAIMLALARFAWHTKVKGGQGAVDTVKNTLDGNLPDAGSNLFENLGSDTQPIKTDSGAKNAYEDGRMVKLQVAAATGIPEQYFGDISTGNLATAKTVEIPMMKQFQSLQQVWSDFYQEMDEVVFAFNKLAPDTWYVDRDFPPIAPRDVTALATAIQQIVQTFPQFADSPAVQQMGLLAIGIDDTAEVLEALDEQIESNPDVELGRQLKKLREVLIKKEKKDD